MKSKDNNECSGQMDLFDYIEADPTDRNNFCWDKDINEIVQDIEKLAVHYNLELGEAEFKVWDHVPNLGYRLWLDVRGTREELKNKIFQSDITKLIAKAKQRNIELTPMWGACMFFTKDENEKGRLSFSTLFKDKARQRIKNR